MKDKLNQCQATCAGGFIEEPCGSYDISVKSKIINGNTIYWAECDKCTYRTESFGSEQEAIDSWNEINYVEPPRELTDEEKLREKKQDEFWCGYYSHFNVHSPMLSLLEGFAKKQSDELKKSLDVSEDTMKKPFNW
jgi:hypothetical protein